MKFISLCSQSLSLEAVTVSFRVQPESTVFSNLAFTKPVLLHVRTSRATEKPWILLHMELDIQSLVNTQAEIVDYWSIPGIWYEATSYTSWGPRVSRGQLKMITQDLTEEGIPGHRAGLDRRNGHWLWSGEKKLRDMLFQTFTLLGEHYYKYRSNYPSLNYDGKEMKYFIGKIYEKKWTVAYKGSEDQEYSSGAQHWPMFDT